MNLRNMRTRLAPYLKLFLALLPALTILGGCLWVVWTFWKVTLLMLVFLAVILALTAACFIALALVGFIAGLCYRYGRWSARYLIDFYNISCEEKRNRLNRIRKNR